MMKLGLLEHLLILLKEEDISFHIKSLEIVSSLKSSICSVFLPEENYQKYVSEKGLFKYLKKNLKKKKNPSFYTLKILSIIYNLRGFSLSFLNYRIYERNSHERNIEIYY